MTPEKPPASASFPAKMLQHLRFDPARSRGRRHAEPPHPYRGIYQRDRDRVIHSRAFRRLERKTQVFTVGESDHIRNRLTHTIEVTQIARTVASALGLNEDLAEALALAHDIGHPPFGHAGEEALDQQMKKYGRRFDHNLHALRIVEHFERRYASFQGLNLTFELREGILKHSRDYDLECFPEFAEYMLEQRPPLESQIIDLADEVTYLCADLDDATGAGILDPDLVREQVPAFDACMIEAQRGHPRASARLVFCEALRRLLDLLVCGLIKGTGEEVRRAGVQSVDEVRDYPRRLSGMSPEAAAACGALRRVLSREVYRSARLSRVREETGQRLTALFEYFMAQPGRLPASYRAEAEAEPVHQVVCDYLAGMTDSFLLRRFEEHLGTSSP